MLELAGLTPDAFREVPLKRRIGACLRALRVHTEDEGMALLRARPELVPLALSTMLIGVSQFFRDPAVFQTLNAEVLPRLAARTAPLRVLSIGCSFGAELYSVAMLMADAGLLDRTSLVGVDCRTDAVMTAGAGIFDETSLGTLDDVRRSRYVEPIHQGHRIVTSIRGRTVWRRVDATQVCPAGPWDLVLCRNLLIYLQHHVIETMLARIVDQIRPGGFVVLGDAERPMSPSRLTRLARCIYQTHGS